MPVIKPSDKVLIGWIILVIAYTSTNLREASASELGPTDLQQLHDANAVTVSEDSETVETSNYTDTASNAAFIAPQIDIYPHEASPQPIPEMEDYVTDAVASQTISALQPQVKSRDAKLERLLATVTREIPITSSFRDGLAQVEGHATIGSIVSETDIHQFESPQPMSELGQVADTVDAQTIPVFQPHVKSRDAKLERLLATVTQEIPITSSLRDSLEQVEEHVTIESTDVGLASSGVSDTDAVNVSNVEPVETAQFPLEPALSSPDIPNQQDVDRVLQQLEQPVGSSGAFQSSPGFTIANPSGFGVDNFRAFIGVGYQERTRFGNVDDGGAVIGIGLGDAHENVGVQLSYTVASFGSSRDFGTGGFNAKVHKRLTEGLSVALGWEGFATTGPVDFEDSIYGSVTHLIRTREHVRQPFSRVALTAGVGNGRFRTEEDIWDGRDTFGVFSSIAVRMVEPVSAIVEWTGQDLAAGLSIAPFRNVPFVMLPAVRDITGAGDGARFVFGAGVSFQL